MPVLATAAFAGLKELRLNKDFDEDHTMDSNRGAVDDVNVGRRGCSFFMWAPSRRHLWGRR